MGSLDIEGAWKKPRREKFSRTREVARSGALFVLSCFDDDVEPMAQAPTKSRSRTERFRSSAELGATTVLGVGMGATILSVEIGFMAVDKAKNSVVSAGRSFRDFAGQAIVAVGFDSNRRELASADEQHGIYIPAENGQGYVIDPTIVEQLKRPFTNEEA